MAPVLVVALASAAGGATTRDPVSRAALPDSPGRDTIPRDTTPRDTLARDTLRTPIPPIPPRPPVGIRIRIGRDTLPLTLPTVQTRSELAAYRRAAAQIAAARATAFHLNARSVLEAVWGEVALQSFTPSGRAPDFPGELQPRRPRTPTRAEQIFTEYSDLGVQLDGRFETRLEKDETNRCRGNTFFLGASACRTAFTPIMDFQYALRSAGVVADRVHVNVDYDSQREFDASNTISIRFDGKQHNLIQQFEIGNVTFQPPPSRFITAAIPSGNYGAQAVMRLGDARLRAIFAQQKGNVVRDRTFTVGDRTLQAVDRTVEDYQFEPRRFFFTVDPRLLPGYPNIDILDNARMARLAASLPDTLRPVRLYVYRLLIGGQPPNPNGPQFRIIGDPRSRRGPVYEYLREGIDYYADPSHLWIALVRPLSLNNERLVVAYRVRVNGVETTWPTTGGTPDLEFTPNRDQFAQLLWDPRLQPGDQAFDREIRSVYRLGGTDVVRQSVGVKVVTGDGHGEEKPVAPGTGGHTAATYLQLFGLAQSTNSSSFDVENRIWPRPTDPDYALGVGVFGQRTIRDQFLVLPSLRPFATTGLAGPANPHNDTLYTTPSEYLNTSQRPPAVYHLRLHYQSQGNGSGGTLLLGSVQIRPNSERIMVDNTLLTRGTDYTVDYDLGRVRFTRPDTLFPRPRQVTVQFEENPLFVETPTSITGTSLEIPLRNGQLNFVALSQSQRSTYTRPMLGLEPQSTLIGGVSTLLSFDADPLTRLVSRLPFGRTDAPSRVTIAGEFAASRPQPRPGQQAYIESFEGEGGVDVRLDQQFWYYSSQPAAGHTLLQRIGPASLDLGRATTLAYQTNVVDSLGRQIRFGIDQIDPRVQLVGAGVSAPEQILWLTLFPLPVGGLRETPTLYDWHTGVTTTGRRWRSIRTPLGPSGTDLTRVENLEFWTLVHVDPATRVLNPTLVFDVGDISENSVTFSPDTVVIRRAAAGARDTTFRGKRLQGFDHLDSERDPFSRTFNANVNDTGLPGDVADSITVITDTARAMPPVVATNQRFTTCNAAGRILYPLGDSRADCTAGNGRLDEEDIDNDNVLNYPSSQRDSEQWRRYVVDLSDDRRFTRTGKCVPSIRLDPTATPGDSVCWVFVRVPFRTPDDTLGDAFLRRARALRITMISAAAAPDSAFTTIALDRLRLTGAPWLKRGDVALHGIAAEQPASPGSFVVTGTIGTQDRQVRNGVDYQSPPGITDLPDLKSAQLGATRLQVNERSLRITAGGLATFDRAEAYYRFPEGSKNFLGYKELRLWARGVSAGWGTNGELQFYVKIGRDASNFYMYHTPLNGGPGRDAWLPEIRVAFSRLVTLRARIQNAYLRGLPPNGCTGLDSALVESTPLPPGAGMRYAACEGGYIAFTTDPGITPPNLAAVQELAVGMLRVGQGTGSRPIAPSDTLELWVDDVRLGGVVDAAGFAGQIGIGVTAGDFADIRATVSRRDPNFRQLGDQPTYLTDNTTDLSAAFHLEKLLPRSFGYSVPLTLNYSSASSAPIYLTGTDLDAGAVNGLRSPRTAATSLTIGVRRSTPLEHGTLAPVVNNLSLTSTYTDGMARTEYQDGRAHDFRVGLEYNLLRAIAPSARTWLPTELLLTTTFERGSDRRAAYLKPAPAPDDTGTTVTGVTRALRNAGRIAIRPFRNATIRLDVTSLRDMRSYDALLGIVNAGERDRIGGIDAGLERQRDIGTQLNYTAQPLGWIRARLNTSSTFTMLRDPNTLAFVRAPHPGAILHIPRRFTNATNTNAGISFDFPALLRGNGSLEPWARRLVDALQPLDIAIDRSVLTAYDGVATAAPLGYQLGIGDIETFRTLGRDSATSAGVSTQFSISHSIRLPFGAVLTNRYQRVTLRNWTHAAGGMLDVGDATQLVFPDIGIRWNTAARSPESPIQRFSLTARMLGTRQLLASPGELDVPFGTSGETRVRSYPITISATLAGTRPVSTTIGANFVHRTDDRPGLAGNGRSLDFNADIARAFALPASWHPRSDLRTRLTFQRSQSQSFVLNPVALAMRSRLTDNGRRAVSLSADTDVADNLVSSFVISRVASFDRNLNREFTQTVLSAVLHLQFYAGELR